ncbi:MAG: AarF/UbiB family protein [Pirellulaceae bacterium]
MVNWEWILDQRAIASVLPNEHAPFARPVCDGLRVFLEGLPPERQQAILTEQASLPLTASISQRLGLLARSCPVLHKLGQILARDPRLSLELREHLQQLESLPPKVPLDQIEATLAAELGDLARLGVKLQPPALAEASVAVVIPYQQHLDDRQPPIEGVFKILKPGIEQRLQQELALVERVGAYLDERCEELDIPHLDYQETFEQVRDKLACEVQLDREQQHLEQARAFYADDPRVLIPRLLEHCTPRVTAMERVLGEKVTEHGFEDRRQKRRLAGLVAKSLVARPIFARSGDALFHSDPHAGNMMLTQDGRLAILDWSLVGALNERERVAVVQILLGAVTLHCGRIVAVLEQLAERRRADRELLVEVVANRLRQVRRGRFPGLTWLVGLLDDAVHLAGLRVAADLMLFRKSLHTLEGLVAELGGDEEQIDQVLRGEFLLHFAKEWPLRWLSLPYSRRFATRLSNADLTETVLSLPLANARFWFGHGLDLVGGMKSR